MASKIRGRSRDLNGAPAHDPEKTGLKTADRSEKVEIQHLNRMPFLCGAFHTVRMASIAELPLRLQSAGDGTYQTAVAYRSPKFPTYPLVRCFPEYRCRACMQTDSLLTADPTRQPSLSLRSQEITIEFEEERDVRSVFVTSHATLVPASITLHAFLPARGTGGNGGRGGEWRALGATPFRNDAGASHRARQKKQIDLRVTTRALKLVVSAVFADNVEQAIALEQICAYGMSIAAAPPSAPAPSMPRPVLPSDPSIGRTSASNSRQAAPAQMQAQAQAHAHMQQHATGAAGSASANASGLSRVDVCVTLCFMPESVE